MLANKLMFTMEESEYDTLLEEFDTILKQMDLIGKIDGIENIDNLILEIANCEDRLAELENANNRSEIVELLKEFSVDAVEPEQIELPDEKKVFEEVEKSDFLRGENDRKWTATFDWIMKESNIIKVKEKNFSSTGSGKNTRLETDFINGYDHTALEQLSRKEEKGYLIYDS